MKATNYLIALALSAIAPLALATSVPDTHTHEHGHEAPAAATTETPTPAQRFAVDAPLQTGMGKIRAAVDSLAHHEMGHLDTKQVVTLATEIDAGVKYLIANCKLDPKADAALHGIIGPLLAGAKSLKDKPEDAAPVAKLRDALVEYPKFFDDNSWLPLAE